MGQQLENHQPPKIYIIGLGGSSASGKSTTSKKLSEKLNSPFLPICGDHFFKSEIPMHDIWGHNYEIPEAVDFESIKIGLKKMKEHFSKTPFEKFKENLRPNKYMKIPIESETHIVNKNTKNIFIIIESFLLYYDKDLCDLIDFHFFISCPQEIARERRMKRDHFCNDKWFDEMVWTHFEKFKEIQLKNSNAKIIDGTQPIEDSVNEIIEKINKNI